MQVNDSFFEQISEEIPYFERQWIKSELIKQGIITSYGVFSIEVYDKFGFLKESRTSLNTLTTNGINELVDLLDENTVNNRIKQLKVGSGTTPPVKADISLDTEATPAAFIPGSHDQPTSNVHRISGFIGSTDYTRPLTINEIGCFFENTDTLFARALLSSPIILNTNDTSTVRYGLIIG